MAQLNKTTQQLDEEKQTAIVRHPNSIAMGNHGVRLTTFEDAFRFAKAVVQSGLAPKSITTPEQALIAIQSGMELGFSPMRALSAIVVVNGKPGLYGEAALAKIREAGVCSKPPTVKVEGEGDARRGIVRFQRRDMDEAVEVSFSVTDAKRAKLWGKSGPWTDYQDDMLGWRAVARTGKLYFSDVLLGLTIAEELQDHPADHTLRSVAPPSEPDPLLIGAKPPEVTATEAEIVAAPTPTPEPIIPEKRVEIPQDEQQLAGAIDKLEGKIVSAESLKELDSAWSNAQATLVKVSQKERERLNKLYRQLAKNFEQ